MNNKKYSSIDFLRAVCSIGIVFMHMMVNTEFEINTTVYSVINFFSNFVFMFMIISSFGLCCGYYEKIQTGNLNLNSFYSKRFKKILPFFSCMVLIDIILNPTLTEIYEGFADITLLFGFIPDFKINVIGVGWFLGVVFIFYFLFPFFCSFAINTKKRAWISMGITMIYNVLCIIYFQEGRRNVIFCSMFFVAGGLIFLYKDILRKTINKYKFAFLIIPMMLTLLEVIIKKEYSKLGAIEYIMQLILFSAWFIYLISIDLRLSTTKSVKFLSKISLEIYLSQMVIFRIIEKCNLVYIGGKGYAGYLILVVADLTGTIAFSYIVSSIIDKIQYILENKLVKKLNT